MRPTSVPCLSGTCRECSATVHGPGPGEPGGEAGLVELERISDARTSCLCWRASPWLACTCNAGEPSFLRSRRYVNLAGCRIGRQERAALVVAHLEQCHRG